MVNFSLENKRTRVDVTFVRNDSANSVSTCRLCLNVTYAWSQLMDATPFGFSKTRGREPAS